MTQRDQSNSVAIVRQLRHRATDLRRIADQLNDQADMLERESSDVPLIGGRRLVDQVVAVLAEASENEDPGWRGMHYSEITEIIERAGLRIRGLDPAATLLANIDRDPRVVSVESRSGRYRLNGSRS